MSEDLPRVFTALNIQSTSLLPSCKNVLWTGVGQLLYCTRSGVQILTPELGFNLDSSALVKGNLSDEDETLQLGWYRTMIPFDKDELQTWIEESQDFATLSLSSLDLCLKSITVSPSGIAADTGCLVAVLTNNMDLLLYSATKNGIRGEWGKTLNVTAVLLEHVRQEVHDSEVSLVLASQICCIDWSPQIPFQLSPKPLTVNKSFLVCGTRAGTLVFFEYRNDALELFHIADVADMWITHVSCSPWTMADPNTYVANVAFGVANGHVGVLKVTQTIEFAMASSPFGLDFDVVSSVNVSVVNLCSPDHRGLTSLQWIKTPVEPILVFSKPGKLYVWSRRHGLTDLTIHPKTFHPVSGLHYLLPEDALVLAFFDGTFRVLKSLSSGRPFWDNEDGASITRSARAVFKAHPDHRTTGFTSFCSPDTLVWAHEDCYPRDLSYKHDAQQKTTLVLAQIRESLSDEELLENVRAAWSKNQELVSSSELRLALFYLRDQACLARIHNGLLESLRDIDADPAEQLSFDSQPDTLVETVKNDLRDSLTRHFFGYASTSSLRSKLSVADFAWKLSDEHARQQDLGSAAQQLLSEIKQRNLRVILRHLNAVANFLTEQDISFVLRLVLLAFLPNNPPDITLSASSLSTLLNEQFSSSSATTGVAERCPACGAEIELQDITVGICPNGHHWARCSVTTFVLLDERVKTCVGCTRKARLPSRRGGLEDDHTEDQKGWFEEVLLEAVRRCLFCGGRFVEL